MDGTLLWVVGVVLILYMVAVMLGIVLTGRLPVALVWLPLPPLMIAFVVLLHAS